MAIKPIEILIKARDEASSVLGSLQGKAAAVGAAIAGYFGISAFVGAVKGAAQLEAKLSEVKAVSNATADEMVQLRKAAEDAGAATKFTATEGADALGNLTRAGLSAKDAIAALPAVLNLAQAGGIGLAEASEYVTKAVQGLGLKFADAGRVADVLAMGANASNASVTGLAQALSYAAPVANSLGLGLETTVAIIGKFSDAGIDASRAGTALNAVLSQFSDPSSKFRQELGSAGIITRNFEQALHELAATGPAGEKAILAVGTEAGPALRALLNQGIGALDDLKKKLGDAAGSAAATAAVMEDNLAGSFNGLSSAWDSVKNSLATPVLPVIREGVVQLADALRNAVNGGTVAKFGEAIASSFQAGLKWAREFVGSIDFAALTQKMQDWAERTAETFKSVGEYATNAGNVVSLAYGVMSAGVNSVKAIVFTLAEAFAGVASNIQSGLALLYEGLSKITFGKVSQAYKLAAEEIRASAGATWAVSEAFAAKAGEAFDAAARGADLARRGFAGLSDSMAKTDSQASGSAKAIASVATALEDVGAAAQEAGQKAKEGAQAQREAADGVRASVTLLKQEYAAALAAGDPQRAAEKLSALNRALQVTAQSATSAAEKAKSLEEAFTRLGITSTAELVKQRDAAKRDYQIIRDSGLATARDIQNAFAEYAARAIAANGGVATEALKAEAAMRGIKITTDETGKSVVNSMGGAADATRRVGNEASAAAGKFDGLAASARGAAAAASGASQVSGINGQGVDFSKYGRPPDRQQGAITGTYSLNAQFELWGKLMNGTLTAYDLPSAQNALRVSQENARLGSAGMVSLEGRTDDQVWISRMAQIVGRVEELKARKEGRITDDPRADYQRALAEQRVQNGPGPRPVPTPAPAPSPAPVPVVIQLPGFGDTRIHVSNNSEARALEQLLASLTEAARRTGP